LLGYRGNDELADIYHSLLGELSPYRDDHRPVTPFCQHAHLCGARYFRGRKPTRVVYQERGDTRSSASSRELEIKKMTRAANTG